MFKKLKDFLELQILILLKELEIKTKQLNEIDIKKQWDLETGEKFNDLVCRYPISEDELLSMAETVCKFVMYTRITNINRYLFEDDKLEKPRILKNVFLQNIFKDLDRTIVRDLQKYEELNLQLLCLTNLDLKTIVEIARTGNLYVDIDDKKVPLHKIGLTLKETGCDFYTVRQNIKCL
jgi:hypothetical protein